MQKLSYDVLEKLHKNKATSAEISLLIYISRYQDDCGNVIGVYYKDACEELGISYQTFYDVLNGLEVKGLIKCAKNSRTDYDVTILDNDFSDGGYKRGYISTSHAIFSAEGFHKMKAGAKLMAMDLMKITYSKGGSYIIGLEKLYKNYMDMFKVTKRVIRSYLHQLKGFFSIGIKDRKYYIAPKSSVKRSSGSLTDKDKANRWFIKTLIRRHRLKVKEEQVKDISGNIMSLHASELKERYQGAWQQKLFDMTEAAVNESLKLINIGLPERKWKRMINVPFVNKIFTKLLNA